MQTIDPDLPGEFKRILALAGKVYVRERGDAEPVLLPGALLAEKAPDEARRCLVRSRRRGCGGNQRGKNCFAEFHVSFSFLYLRETAPERVRRL